MSDAPISAYQLKVITACEAVLKREGSVGLVELCQQLGYLHFAHVADWKHGKPHATPLHKNLQLGAEKLRKVMNTLERWATEKGMTPLHVPYERQGLSGPESLPILLVDEPEFDALWRRHWIPAGLTAKKAEKLEAKLTKAEGLVVFSQSSDVQKCSECGTETHRGDFFVLDADQPVCLSCADFDHLEFLPRGDATLTRRARKFSPLAAEVLEFNRRRKHYDRIGLLVTAEAIDQAEASMDEDADSRAAQRHKAAAARAKTDEKLVEGMTALILRDFPNCPPQEAHQIAAHTAVRGSGRVGRSEAGRNLDTNAIELAVIAWIRHQHTNYDNLLMTGVPRKTARDRIRSTVQQQLQKWR